MARRALIIVDHIGRGGTLPFVSRYAKFLTKNGFECSLNGAPFEDVLSGRVRPPIELARATGFFRSLRFLLRRNNKYTIISANSPKGIIYAALVKVATSQTALITFTLHWPVDSSRFAARLKRLIYCIPGRIHAISASIRDVLLDRYLVSPQRILTFNVDVDARRFVPWNLENRCKFYRELGINASYPILGYVGRLDQEKNIDFIIRFADEYGRNIRPVNVLIYGDGPLIGRIVSQIDKLSGPSEVKYMGFTDTPECALATLDLNILPSSVEGFPLVVAEAGLCGTPTLRSSVEGGHEQIKDGETGFLFDIDHGYEAFYDRLARVFDATGHDPAEFRPALREIGLSARQHFQKICGSEDFERNCEELFSEALLKSGCQSGRSA